MRNKIVSYLAIILLFSVLPQFISPGEEIWPQGDKKLEDILNRCSDYCEKISRAQISFHCRERITEKIFHHHLGAGRVLDYPEDKSLRKNEENDYVYDYLFILKDCSYSEERILLEQNGQKTKAKETSLKTKLYGKNVPFFAPVEALSRESQGQYEYKIIREDIFKKERAVVIEAIPTDDLESACLSGKIWASVSDGGILRIEWKLTCPRDFSSITATTKGLRVDPQFTFIMDFGYARNSIRFPTKYYIQEVYIEPLEKKRFVRSETTVIYSDYVFSLPNNGGIKVFSKADDKYLN
jgi:hypothetical protein